MAGLPYLPSAGLRLAPKRTRQRGNRTSADQSSDNEQPAIGENRVVDQSHCYRQSETGCQHHDGQLAPHDTLPAGNDRPERYHRRGLKKALVGFSSAPEKFRILMACAGCGEDSQ